MGTAPAELSEALRRAIQAREIDAEHVEQLMLVAAVPRQSNAQVPLATRLDDASRNALNYLAVLNATVDAAAKGNLAVILGAAFPDAAPSAAAAALAAVAA